MFDMGDFDKGEMYENEFEKQKFEQFLMLIVKMFQLQ